MQVVPRTDGATIFVGWQERVAFQGCPASGPIPPTSSCGLPAANGDPRIVITRSFDGGATWSDWLGTANQRRAVDFGDRDVDAFGQPAPPPPGFGYLPRYTDEERKSRGQLMPHLSYGGGRLGLFYYEARGPLTSVPGTNGLLSGVDRQLDARFALLNPRRAVSPARPKSRVIQSSSGRHLRPGRKLSPTSPRSRRVYPK